MRQKQNPIKRAAAVALALVLMTATFPMQPLSAAVQSVSEPQVSTAVNADTTGIRFSAVYAEEPRSFFQRVVNGLTFGLFYPTEAEIVVTLEGDYDDISEFAWFMAEADYNLNFAWHDPVAVRAVTGMDTEVTFVPVTAGEIEDGQFRFTIPVQRSGYVAVAVYDNAGNGSYEQRNRQMAYVHIPDGSGYAEINTDAQKPDMPSVSMSAGENGAWTSETVEIILSDKSVFSHEGYSGTNYFEYAVVPASQGSGRPAESDYALLDESTFRSIHPNQTGVYYDAQGGSHTVPAMENPRNGKDYIADQLTISTDTNATYYFRTVSMTGLASEPVAVPVRVQKTAPQNGTVKVTRGTLGENSWYTTSTELTMTAPTRSSSAASAVMSYEIRNDDTGALTASGSVSNAAGAASSVQETLTDGRYTITYWTTDAAGTSTRTEALRIKVDATAPTVRELALTAGGTKYDIRSAKQGSAAFGQWFFQNAVTLTASAVDAMTDIRFDYQIVSSYSEFSVNGYWSTFPADGRRIVPNERFVVIVRAMDEAGNVTYCNSDGVIVDKLPPVGETQAPDIDILPEAANANGYYNGEVSVSIAVKDPAFTSSFAGRAEGYAGLASVTYRILEGDTELEHGTLFDESRDSRKTDKDGLVQSWTGSVSASGSGEVIVEITAVDNAGNERVTCSVPLLIDTDAPDVEFRYTNNDVNTMGGVHYFDEPRTVEITVTERNFDGADVQVLVNGSPVSLSWTASGAQHTARYPFDQDGDYTFAVSYTDLAGNDAGSVEPASGTAAPYAFTIDTTAPVISVAYDDAPAENEKYFQSDRTATVTITEHNFSDSTIIVDGSPRSVAWTGAGTDAYRASVTVSGDGQHTFAVSSTDRAGNLTLDKDTDYGDSVAPNMFIIDEKNPAVEVSIYDAGRDATYTDSGHAIKGGVIPEVTLSDENYASYSCKLYRTRMNDIHHDVSDQFLCALVQQDDGSWHGTFDSFDKIQDNDGIYTLEVCATDLSGRTTEKSITFSVNRFGSVYVYSDDLVAMQDTYRQNVDGDIVISEFNADELAPESIRIEITRDSAPLTDVQYTPTPALDQGAEGESGWYEYNYTIHASNFTEDGIYKIVVSSKDAAGNHSETLNYDDKAVVFRLDRTAPELLNVRGLEATPINAESVEVGYEVFDAIGLARVTVFVNDTVVREVTDFENQVQLADTFRMTEGMSQHVRILIEDRAGNQLDTDAGGFDPAFRFERNVTISTNVFIRWFKTPVLFWGSIGGTAAVLLLLAALLLRNVRNKRA